MEAAVEVVNCRHVTKNHAAHTPREPLTPRLVGPAHARAGRLVGGAGGSNALAMDDGRQPAGDPSEQRRHAHLCSWGTWDTVSRTSTTTSTSACATPAAAGWRRRGAATDAPGGGDARGTPRTWRRRRRRRAKARFTSSGNSLRAQTTAGARDRVRVFDLDYIGTYAPPPDLGACKDLRPHRGRMPRTRDAARDTRG